MAKTGEWWKMDDARVSRVTAEEVMQAEAYMLLYRAFKHPILLDIQSSYQEHLTAAVNAENAVAESSRQQDSAEQPTDDDSKKRKRDMEQFVNGEEWAAKKTRLPPVINTLFRRVEDSVADNVDICPQYYSSNIEGNARAERGPPESISGT